MQKLTSRSKFAKLAGVNPSTTTRLSETVLKAATVGKFIDAAHPDAIKYLADRADIQTRPDPEPVATGLDPLYELAFNSCTEAGNWSASFVKRSCHTGYKRASNIVEVMRLNGVIPDKKSQKPTPSPPPPKPKPVVVSTPPPEENELLEMPEDIQSFADMTLRSLIDKFGTDERFVNWLNATQKIEAINEKRLKNAATEGELVSRKLVRIGIIEPFDEAHIKMLTDGATTLAVRVTAMHDGSATIAEIEEFIKDQISSFIKPVKARVARTLKNA